MLVGRKYSGDPTVTEPPHRFHRIASAVRGRLDSLPLSSYRKTEESYWTLGWLPNRIDRAVQELAPDIVHRSEEHTSELQSLMRISYAVFCLKKKKTSNS